MLLHYMVKTFHVTYKHHAQGRDCFQYHSNAYVHDWMQFESWKVQDQREAPLEYSYFYPNNMSTRSE
jgi:hypothetical protein